MNAPIEGEWEKKHVYQLYGVVTHAGSMSGGHYVAYVWYTYVYMLSLKINFYRLGKDRHWFYWSDSSVKNIEEEEALCAEAYVLFYRKIL